MLYHITAPPVAAPEKQADELVRLLKHSKTLTVQFVTVAGSYKPARARLVVFATPDRFAEQAARVIAVLSGREDSTKPSQAIRLRPEWKNVALLVPTDPAAPAIDGVLLDGWDSAFLTVSYRLGRVLGRLLHCPEDSERVAALKLDGWRLIAKPNPLQLLANAAGRPWNGVPSFAPVPGGVMVPAAPRSAAAKREVPPTIDAPAPIRQEIKGALTESADGFLLGVTPDGSGIRLTRRAMTLAVSGPQDARQRAVLALLRRGMQAGMGMIVMVDRTLLPTEALQTWEARVRLLDVQNITDSSAIPWREIAPDLLAQAIGGPSASLPALPSRFGAVLDTLGAESLRVPAVLGLATMPADNLRGALAAGGMVVVPQDGDAASTVVARLLMAYLATPPAIGRGLLILADPAIVPPEALRQQAIQVVIGERSDALLRLGATDAGWKLCTPDGSPVAELLPDLMTQPIEGAGDMVDSIVRNIGTETLDVPTVAAIEQAPAVVAAEEIALVEEAPAFAADELADEGTGWWSNDERTDALDKVDEETTDGIGMAAIEDAAPAVPADEPAANEMQPTELVTNDEEPAGELDTALGSLLHALTADVPANETEELIQAAVEREDFATADTAALAWSVEAPQLALPWIWRVVLAEEDADRAVAAWRAMQIDPDGAHAPLVRAVLDAMDAAETAPVAATPTATSEDLSNDAIRAAWQAGESMPQLVARLVARGVDAPTARMRLRTIVNASSISGEWTNSSISGAPIAPMPPQAPPAEVPPAVISALPKPIMPGGGLDDQAIWGCWLAGARSDEIVVGMSGRRGGPKAEAARDHMYRVVIPRIIALLDCDALVDRIAAGESATADPRYSELMKRLARSENPPAGNLERALARRLIAVWQEV